MLKKISWIVALFAAFTIVFIGCTNLGTLDDGSRPVVAEDLVYEGADLVGMIKACGQSQSKVVIDGAKVTLDANNTGFYFDFPAESADYAEIQVFFKIIEVFAGTGPGLLIKRNTSFQNPIGITSDQDPEYQLNNVGGAGTEFNTGLWKTNRFDNQMAFQNQIYNPDGNSDSKFTVEVLKILFPGGGEPPEPPLVPPGYTGADNKVFYLISSETVIDTDPTIVGDFGMTISDKGVVNMGNGAYIKYKFPTKAFDGQKSIDVNLEKDWDFIEIDYTVSDVVTTSGGSGHFKVRFREYNNGNAYTYNGPNSNEWPDFGGTGHGSWNTQTLGAQGTGGFAINYNYGDRATSGADSLKVKINSVTFTKGNKFDVLFYDPATGFTKKSIVLDGNSLGSELPTNANILPRAKWGTGADDVWTFLGWTSDENQALDIIPPALPQFDGGVGAKDELSAPANGLLVLGAVWYKAKIEPVVVTATGTNTLFSAVGNYADAPAAATYTYNGKSWWIVSQGSSQGYAFNVAPVTLTPALDLDDVKTKQLAYGTGGGYTRLGYEIPNNAKIFTKVTLTYDFIVIDGANPGGSNARAVEFRHSDTAAGGSTIANGGYDNTPTPWLEIGDNKTISYPVSEFTNGSGWISIVKNNATSSNLLRITKIEFSLD